MKFSATSVTCSPLEAANRLSTSCEDGIVRTQRADEPVGITSNSLCDVDDSVFVLGITKTIHHKDAESTEYAQRKTVPGVPGVSGVPLRYTQALCCRLFS